jgi:hypothetical protein
LHRRFLHQCPIFERLLVEDGILLRKYWFSVSDNEQQRRFRSRRRHSTWKPTVCPIFKGSSTEASDTTGTAIAIVTVPGSSIATAMSIGARIAATATTDPAIAVTAISGSRRPPS